MQATQDMERLRYPIGRFGLDGAPDAAKRTAWLSAIEELPSRLRDAVSGLDDAALDTPYRPDGWTVRQVVHHVADSHVNAYCRLKLALTEESPEVRDYEEHLWAELPDSRLPVEVSLSLLDALHARWATLLRSLDGGGFARVWVHPKHGPRDLDFMLQLYAWHGRHHAAHVTALRERRGWR